MPATLASAHLVPLWDRLPQELVARVVMLAEPRALVTLVFIERRARDASQPRLTALGALRLPPCRMRVHGPPDEPDASGGPDARDLPGEPDGTGQWEMGWVAYDDALE